MQVNITNFYQTNALYEEFVRVSALMNKHERDYFVTTGGGTFNVAAGELLRATIRIYGDEFSFQTSLKKLETAFENAGEEPCFMGQFFPGTWSPENTGDVWDAIRISILRSIKFFKRELEALEQIKLLIPVKIYITKLERLEKLLAKAQRALKQVMPKANIIFQPRN